jgi:hypothetical protein
MRREFGELEPGVLVILVILLLALLYVLFISMFIVA